jgi:hypothetical protein
VLAKHSDSQGATEWVGTAERVAVVLAVGRARFGGMGVATDAVTPVIADRADGAADWLLGNRTASLEVLGHGSMAALDGFGASPGDGLARVRSARAI